MHSTGDIYEHMVGAYKWVCLCACEVAFYWRIWGGLSWRLKALKCYSLVLVVFAGHKDFVLLLWNFHCKTSCTSTCIAKAVLAGWVNKDLMSTFNLRKINCDLFLINITIFVSKPLRCLSFKCVVLQAIYKVAENCPLPQTFLPPYRQKNKVLVTGKWKDFL